MALRSVTLNGSTPIGDPLLRRGLRMLTPARFAVALAGAACLIALVLGAVAIHGTPPGERRSPPTVQIDWVASMHACGVQAVPPGRPSVG